MEERTYVQQQNNRSPPLPEEDIIFISMTQKELIHFKNKRIVTTATTSVMFAVANTWNFSKKQVKRMKGQRLQSILVGDCKRNNTDLRKNIANNLIHRHMYMITIKC